MVHFAPRQKPIAIQKQKHSNRQIENHSNRQIVHYTTYIIFKMAFGFPIDYKVFFSGKQLMSCGHEYLNFPLKMVASFSGEMPSFCKTAKISEKWYDGIWGLNLLLDLILLLCNLRDICNCLIFLRLILFNISRCLFKFLQH